MKKFNVKEQVNHFKELSHSEKLRIVKANLNILGDDAWEEISTLKDTINNFWDSATDEDLIWIFESIMELIAHFRESENEKK